MTGGRSLKGLVRLLGPGLLTGAADDDPSGIATYSQSGAQFGYALCWTMFLTTPFMVAVQIVSARIGSVTGRGLAANLGEVLPPVLLYGIVALTAAANTVNIAADIAAMGEAVRLLVGGPAVVYALTLGGICAAAQIVIPYRPYARYMKVLTLVLFAYVAAAFSLRLPWGEVLASTFIPRLSWQRDFVVMVVAVLGTTISPYLFFWQASLEVEERRVMERKKEAPLQNGNAAARRRFEPIVIDTFMPTGSTRLAPRRTPPRHCVPLPGGRRFCCFRLASSAPDYWRSRRLPARPLTPSPRPSAGREASACGRSEPLRSISSSAARPWLARSAP